MSDVLIRAVVHENSNIHLQIIRDNDIVFLYTENGECILYIGPYSGKYLYVNEEYRTTVSSAAYRRFIGTLLHATLVYNCSLVNSQFILNPVVPEVLNRCTFSDSWEWFEIANDVGVRTMHTSDVYTYFMQRPHSLQSLQHCIHDEVVYNILRALDSYFDGITAPNKNIMSSIRITKKPLCVRVLPEKQAIPTTV